jgi:hypothetical protein
MTEEKKKKRVNSYNLALKEWNENRKKQGHKWSSPKKNTEEYKQVQVIKKRIEEEKKPKPIKKVVHFKDGTEEKKEKTNNNAKKKDNYNATLKKLMKLNSVLTEKIVKETNHKQLLDLVEKLKMNTQMIKNVRELKNNQ